MRTQSTTKTASKNQAAAAARRAAKTPKVDPALIERLNGMSLRRMRFFLFSQLLDYPRDRSVTPLITKELWSSGIEEVRAFVRQHLMHYVEAATTREARDE